MTPRDVLEAIAGEFKPEQPDDSWATRREDGSWLLDGIIPIPEMKDVLSLNTFLKRKPADTARLQAW